MARRKRLPKSRSRRGRGKLAALFVLLCGLGAGVWFWWRDYYQPPPKAAPPRAAQAPATNRPAAPTQPVRQPTNNSIVIPPPPSNQVVTPAQAATNQVVRKETAQSADTFPRPSRTMLEAQIALARRGISSGSIDGVPGSQTRAALLAFQQQHGLVASLQLDEPTRAALTLDSAPLTDYMITSNNLARLQPVSKTWLGKSQQTALDYESLLELVAEAGHASPGLIRRLNPGIDWTQVRAETVVQLPAVEYPMRAVKAAFAVISLGEKKLQAFDANTNLLTHFPCSIAARVEKRPAGELHVTAIAENPNYTFNPEVFPESAEARELGRKLILPPGPNNPVGTAWISLDLPGYGIHGTPSPEQVGRTESHGCFRLANWNASYLVKLVWVGMPVYVEP